MSSHLLMFGIVFVACDMRIFFFFLKLGRGWGDRGLVWCWVANVVEGDMHDAWLFGSHFG